jgi:hypothetical protein
MVVATVAELAHSQDKDKRKKFNSVGVVKRTNRYASHASHHEIANSSVFDSFLEIIAKHHPKATITKDEHKKLTENWVTYLSFLKSVSQFHSYDRPPHQIFTSWSHRLHLTYSS